MKIVAVDPSGNFSEGKGCTGICFGDEYGVGVDFLSVDAKSFETAQKYHTAVIDLIVKLKPDYVVVEAYVLYNFAGQKAETQSFSAMETSQLIGAIKYVLSGKNIPVYEQRACDVKKRWSDKVLQAIGILETTKRMPKINGVPTITHQRDAFRHYKHFITYKLPKILKGSR